MAKENDGFPYVGKTVHFYHDLWDVRDQQPQAAIITYVGPTAVDLQVFSDHTNYGDHREVKRAYSFLPSPNHWTNIPEES